MRVIHCCLSCFYIDGYAYQENELIRNHVVAGHEVLVLASTETYDQHQRKTYCAPGEYAGEEGANVIRLPFSKLLPLRIMKKIKAYPRVMEHLNNFKPDVIMFHGLGSFDLLTVSEYKRNNPNTILYADNHADSNNSAQGFFSKLILHKIFYKWIINKSLPQINKILCISLESKKFCSSTYSIPEENLEFFPLGGDVFDDKEYFSRRNQCRKRYNLNEDHVLFLQTGKFNRKKKLLDSLKAFHNTRDLNFRFFIVGGLLDGIEETVKSLIENDERVFFLGWMDSDAIKSLLCAADIYVQPGSQSATMQMSLCARCPVILDDVESHRIFVDGNGWLTSSENELKKVFSEIEHNSKLLMQMSLKSYSISRVILDYKKLSKRILS